MGALRRDSTLGLLGCLRLTSTPREVEGREARDERIPRHPETGAEPGPTRLARLQAHHGGTPSRGQAAGAPGTHSRRARAREHNSLIFIEIGLACQIRTDDPQRPRNTGGSVKSYTALAGSQRVMELNYQTTANFLKTRGAATEGFKDVVKKGNSI